MNKHGQVLVIFILLLPIIFIFLGITIDLGNNLITKRKNENTINDVLLFTLKDAEFNEAKFKKNLDKNLSYEIMEISTEDNILKIKVVSKLKTVFNIFDLGFDKIEVLVKYDLENKRIIRK